MKVALAQINTTVADIPGNSAKSLDFTRRAQAQGAQLVVFPEQSLTGYPALDLWENAEFAQASRRALASLARQIGEIGIIVGFIDENKKRVGKPAANAAALLHRGKIAAVRWKSLLPTYDVFDEARYFEPAAMNKPVRFAGKSLGITICEDAWALDGSGRRLYTKDPVQQQARAGADLLINISASPFVRGKTRQRVKLLSAHAKKARLPLFYCNQVGGNDEIIFDGSSFVFDSRGRLSALGALCAEDLILVDTEALPKAPQRTLPDDLDEVAAALCLGIRDYISKCGFKRVLIGLSGGIDSAVVAALAARALGPEHVTGVLMPSMYSSEGSLTDAEALAKNLGIRTLKIPITPVFESYGAALKQAFASVGGDPGLAEQNLQSRIRGNYLMALSNKEGSLVLTTGNKSELSVGYCTLYGDMSGALAPLADVPKKTVYDLARWFNSEGIVVPQSSIDKAPSAELKPDQKDQDDLPPYDTVDAVLEAYIEERLGVEGITRRGVDHDTASQLLTRIDRAEYKRRQAPPSLKISAKSFGVGRRMPIARGAFRA